MSIVLKLSHSKYLGQGGVIGALVKCFQISIDSGRKNMTKCPFSVSNMEQKTPSVHARVLNAQQKRRRLKEPLVPVSDTEGVDLPLFSE